MNKPNPYINTLYLMVHFALNVLVVILVFDIINAFVPIKHFVAGYHLPQISLSALYPPTMLEKNIAAAIAVALTVRYYQKRKAKNSDTHFKYHLPNLREVEEYFRSKF